MSAFVKSGRGLCGQSIMEEMQKQAQEKSRAEWEAKVRLQNPPALLSEAQKAAQGIGPRVGIKQGL